MSLRDRLNTELKAAMRSHDAVRLDALRMVLAAVQRAEKEGKALCCNRMQRRVEFAPGLR